MLLAAVLLIVSAWSTESASVIKPKITDPNLDVIRFPDDDTTEIDSRSAKLQAALENRFGNNGVHDSCKHQTFCTIMPTNYPEEKFNVMFKAFETQGKRQRRETNTKGDNNTVHSNGIPQQNSAKIPLMPTVDVLDNQHGDSFYENGCETLTTFEPLYKVRPKRDEDAWRTVVQAPSRDFVQRIRLETCLSTGSCFTPLLDSNPQYETACVQMYTVWELLVESETGNDTEKIRVDLPTCCSCKYRRTY